MNQTVKVRLELGRQLIPTAQANDLGVGGLVALDRGLDDRLDVYVAGQLRARGRAVVVDGKVAVRIEEIVGPSVGAMP
jgi:flagellar motor switch/type III secretory pathway protein FliN